jgi:hypothetical protein
VFADSVGLALLVVLETLTPAERLAFVLHDMFAVPFEDIAEIVGGVVVVRGGETVAVVRFGVERGRIAAIDVVADPARLHGLVPVRPSD